MRYQLRGSEASALMKFNHRTPEELPDWIEFVRKYVLTGGKNYNLVVGNKGHVTLFCNASSDLGIIELKGSSRFENKAKKEEQLAKTKLEKELGFKLN